MKELLEIIEALEKRVAALEVQAQEQQCTNSTLKEISQQITEAIRDNKRGIQRMRFD